MKSRISPRTQIRRLKREVLALIVFSSAIFGVFIGVNGPAAIFYPQVTTMFLHYNLQYRAGDYAVEQTILNESLREMVGMYERHPNWKYTIEIQAYAIERLLNEPETFPGILEMMQKQNARGQMELICGVYSSQIINAYPADALNLSVYLTRTLLDQANLTRSRAMLFQEGQYAPGLAHLLNTGDWEGVDTVIISEQQLMDFWPVWQKAPPKDVPLFISELGGKQNYILRYDYLPRIEAGMYHGWMYWSDAELAIEYDKTPEGKTEFAVDPERLANWEAHYANLERRGNKFMTIAEWIQHCLSTDHVMELGHYQVSTHWGPTKYNTCFTWFGDNSGNVDDGDMLASNYRGRNVLAATRILNETYFHLLPPASQQKVNAYLNQAIRSMLLAMVTDTTGINPNPTEREYGYKNILTVFQNCSQVVNEFILNIPDLNGLNQIQVQLASKTFNLSPVNPLQYTSSNLTDFPGVIPLAFNWATNKVPPTIIAQNASFTVFDKGMQNFELIALSVSFPGGSNWSVRETDVSITFSGSVNQIMYCPPMVEDMTVRVNRSDYTSEDILNFHLPLSNGLIFIPDAIGSNSGFAIIHNVSQYHIAPRWKSSSITYMTGKLVFPAPFQFYLIPQINVTDAALLANRINNQLLWTIGNNVTQMQGFEYLNQYFNSYRGDQWTSGEWWK
jgi:hypothetical protein